MVTAEDVYARFKHLPGSDFIASENAIRGLIGLLRQYRPARILEMGSGIGTLSYAIIKTMNEVRPGNYQLVLVESEAFCREQLPINLASDFPTAKLVRDGTEVPEGQYDLIIIDGGDTVDSRYLRFLAPRALIFVEGHREPQRRIVEQSGRPYVRALHRSMRMEHAAAHHRRDGTAQVRWSGGYWVYLMNPTPFERLRFRLSHLWHGLLVTKRRQLKLARLASVHAAKRPASLS